MMAATLATLEERLRQKVEEKEIPGAVLKAASRDGTFTYTHTTGYRSLQTLAPMTSDTVMWIASCTKLLTSIAAMQLVEQGLLSLDAPVYGILPELKDHPVLTGFGDDGKPILVPHKKEITLRLLLTHSSGLGYGFVDKRLLEYERYVKEKEQRGQGEEKDNAGESGKGTIVGMYSAPLVFEPGTQWGYGCGIDWAGVMVERVSGVELEVYFEKYILDKVGREAREITFWVKKNEGMMGRMADMALRDAQTGKVEWCPGSLAGFDWESGSITACVGGGGLLATPDAYFAVLRKVLRTEKDIEEGVRTALFEKREMLEMFFAPQLTDAARKSLNDTLMDPDLNNLYGCTELGKRKDWGLGGLLVLQDSSDGTLREGSMVWGGLPNLKWFIDRKTGICGFYAGQVIPPGDARIAEIIREFRRTVYEARRMEEGRKLKL